MCHLIGAVLLVASMGLCYLYSLLSDEACPVLDTSESGRNPVVWIVIFSSLISLACCFLWCLISPAQQSHRHREDDGDGPATVALVAMAPHAD